MKHSHALAFFFFSTAVTKMVVVPSVTVLESVVHAATATSDKHVEYIILVVVVDANKALQWWKVSKRCVAGSPSTSRNFTTVWKI